MKMRSFQTVAPLLLIAFITNSALALRFGRLKNNKPAVDPYGRPMDQYYSGSPYPYGYGHQMSGPPTSGSNMKGNIIGAATGIGLQGAGSMVTNKLFGSGGSSAPASGPPGTSGNTASVPPSGNSGTPAPAYVCSPSPDLPSFPPMNRFNDKNLTYDRFSQSWNSSPSPSQWSGI
jgi:hypothetical protein